ncbi:hypothetical protein KY362_02150 [Candidatus Woesearchaeota archaeon]|nr:hypothetical protein [Candidatus Woesearchaeota archaeon]
MNALAEAELVIEESPTTLEINTLFLRHKIRDRISHILMDSYGRIRPEYAKYFDRYADKEYPSRKHGMPARADQKDYLGLINLPKFAKEHLWRDEVINASLEVLFRSPREEESSYEKKMYVAEMNRRLLLVDMLSAVLGEAGDVSYTEEWQSAAASEGNECVLEQDFRFPVSANRVNARSTRPFLEYWGGPAGPNRMLRVLDWGTGSRCRTSFEEVEYMMQMAPVIPAIRRALRNSRFFVNDVSLDALVKGMRFLEGKLHSAHKLLELTAVGSVVPIPANFVDLASKSAQKEYKAMFGKVDLNITGGARCHSNRKDTIFSAERRLTRHDGVSHGWDYRNWCWGAENMLLSPDSRRWVEYEISFDDARTTTHMYPEDYELNKWERNLLYIDMENAKECRATAYMTRTDFLSNRANFTGLLTLLGYVWTETGTGEVKGRKHKENGERIDRWLYRHFTEQMRQGSRFSYSEFLSYLPLMLDDSSPHGEECPWFCLEGQHYSGYAQQMIDAGYGEAIDVGAPAAFLRFGEESDLEFIRGAYVEPEDVAKLNDWFGEDEDFTRRARDYAPVSLDELLERPAFPASIEQLPANMTFFTFARPERSSLLRCYSGLREDS